MKDYPTFSIHSWFQNLPFSCSSIMEALSLKLRRKVVGGDLSGVAGLKYRDCSDFRVVLQVVDLRKPGNF